MSSTEKKNARNICPVCKQSYSRTYLYEHIRSGICKKRKLGDLDELECSSPPPAAGKKVCGTSSADGSQDIINCATSACLSPSGMHMCTEIQNNCDDVDVSYAYDSYESDASSRSRSISSPIGMEHLQLGDFCNDIYSDSDGNGYDTTHHSNTDDDNEHINNSAAAAAAADDAYGESERNMDVDHDGDKKAEDTELSCEIEQPSIDQDTELVRTYVKVAALIQAKQKLSDTTMTMFTSFVHNYLNLVAEYYPSLQDLANLIPNSLHRFWKIIGNEKRKFKEYVVCYSCWEIRDYDDCWTKYRGKKISKQCNTKKQPYHSQASRRKELCGKTLLNAVKLTQDKEMLVPRFVYCYKPLRETLTYFHQNAMFREQCQIWKSHTKVQGLYTDIYDAELWENFTTLYGDDQYRLLLNVDFYQAHKFTQYSCGGIYLVVLNLPREERLKIENMILVGIIPDFGKYSKEPDIRTFIEPLVSELTDFWDGIQVEVEGKKEIIKAALFIISSDLPMTKKLAGFVGHTAYLGCHRCYHVFSGNIRLKTKRYSGFDVKSWKPREFEQHKQHVAEIIAAKSKTTKMLLQRKYGVKPTPLLKLPYFNPITMVACDIMHSCFLGVSKKVIQVWRSRGVLTAKSALEIQDRMDLVQAPTNLGTIPTKIGTAEGFSGLTAEQYMIFTNTYSLMVLADVIGDAHLAIWKKFVLASRLLCCNIMTEAYIVATEKYLLSFCRDYQEKYGEESVNPNIHSLPHIPPYCRLHSCPSQYWLYGLERANGCIKKLPTNQRSLERQYMARFLRDYSVRPLKIPAFHEEKLKETLVKVNYISPTSAKGNANETLTEKQLNAYDHLQLSKGNNRDRKTDLTLLSHNVVNCKTAFLKNVFNDLYTLGTKIYVAFTERQLYALKAFYKKMYDQGDFETLVIPTGAYMCFTARIGNEIFGTTKSRYKNYSKIMAYWNVEGQVEVKNILDINSLHAGQIENIFLHKVRVGDITQEMILLEVSWYHREKLEKLNKKQRLVVGRRYSLPVQIYKRDGVFDLYGESAFMPIQRVRCKSVEMAKVIAIDKKTIECRLVCSVSQHLSF